MRGSSYHSQYEASQYKEMGMRAADSAQSYREKYLELRKMLRDFSNTYHYAFPDHINKAIGKKK